MSEHKVLIHFIILILKLLLNAQVFYVWKYILQYFDETPVDFVTAQSKALSDWFSITKTAEKGAIFFDSIEKQGNSLSLKRKFEQEWNVLNLTEFDSNVSKC